MLLEETGSHGRAMAVAIWLTVELRWGGPPFSVAILKS